MSKTLDKTRDYGTIHGDNVSARYVQDGVYFDVYGNEIGVKAAGKPVAKPQPSGTAQAPSAVDEQLSKQASA